MHCSFTVKNIGAREGKEVAQLYFRERVTSVTTPEKRLIRFKKVDLNPGEAKELSFDIPKSELTIWNANLKEVFEAGTFDLMVGRNADDIVL